MKILNVKVLTPSMPCPFCGQYEGKVCKDEDEVYVRCGYCGAKGPWAGDVADASNLWDTRKDAK